MALPESVSVTFSEEDAQYLTVRPVQRQHLRVTQLCELVLSVTGRDPARVAHILRAGTIVYNFYRYRWPSLDISAVEVDGLLAQFPGDDRLRIFHTGECTAVLLAERGVQAAQLSATAVEFRRADAQRKRLRAAVAFGAGRSSVWDLLMQQSARGVSYAGYSYARRADLFAQELSRGEAAGLAEQAAKLAPRDLRPHAARIVSAARLLYVCPRRSRE